MQAAERLNLTLDEFAAWCRERGTDLGSIDFTKPIKKSIQILVSYTKQNFDEGHSPDGVPWVPLQHPRLRGGDKPLRDRGLLMASLTGRSGQGHIEEVTGNSLIWGTNLEYAATHQYGATIRASSAGALTIPLTVEALQAGSARNFPSKLFVWRRNDKAYLAQRKDKRGLVFHYLLLKEVTIPARPFLGINQEMARDIEAVFSEYLHELMMRG